MADPSVEAASASNGGNAATRPALPDDACPRLRDWLAKPQHWQVVGPFPAGPPYESVPEPFEPEREPAKADYRTSTGKVVAWQDVVVQPWRQEVLRSTGGSAPDRRVWRSIDLVRVCGAMANAVAYARAQFDYAGPAREVVLRIASDDGVKVWLNGEVLPASARFRIFTPQEDHVSVALRTGPNTLLVKIANGIGGWRFALDVVDEAGVPIAVTWKRIEN